MNKESAKPKRKFGRPAKGEPPRVPYEEVDRILVFGEVVPCGDGEKKTVYYPSYRELAARYGVSHSIIARYAREHNCKRRRKQANARVEIEADRKLVDLRSTAIAVSKDEELCIIDTYLRGFATAMEEGRVRFDNATDFNTMVRLKQFIQGGADSRQEVHASLSLEDLQARHRIMLKAIQESSAAERGELRNPMLVSPSSGSHNQRPFPPTTPSETAVEDVHGDFSPGDFAHAPPAGCAPSYAVDHDRSTCDEGLNAPARHSPNLGYTEAHVPGDDYDDVERDVE